MTEDQHKRLANLADCLRNPETSARLTLEGEALLGADGRQFAVTGGIPSLVYPESLSGNNQQWNRFYERMAPFYDVMQRVVGRMVFGVSASEAHAQVIERLGLVPGIKLLEVSPGPGVFHAHLRRCLGPRGTLVSLDLSWAMLRQCQLRGDPDAVLVHGNAEYLPFADGSFDAVFHFGGVNLFNEPDRALRELVRVARPGGLVAWGDEGFSKDYPEGLKKRILTKMNPGYLRPIPPVPPGLAGHEVTPVYKGLGYLVVARKAA